MRTRTMTIPVTIEPLEIDDDTTYGEVSTMLNDVIRRVFDNYEGGFSCDQNIPADTKWNTLRKRWLYAFAVEGNSEGHYVHVDTMSGYDAGELNEPLEGRAFHPFLLKTFDGYERAVQIANVAQFLLTGGY